MAVHIRFQRKGATHRPFYQLVATDSRNPRDGRFLEKLGYYDPAKEPSLFEFRGERVQHWYSKGAQLSPTVKKLFQKKKVELTREQTVASKKEA